MYEYCIFCEDRRRKQLAEALAWRFGCRSLVPQIAQRKRIKGQMFEELHDFLPGYLFLFSEVPLRDFDSLRQHPAVLRLLGEKKLGYRLQAGDRDFADMLLENNGIIGALKTYREGDRIRIAEQKAFRGAEGEIVKIDRKKRMMVRFHFDGVAFEAWVGYDMVE